MENIHYKSDVEAVDALVQKYSILKSEIARVIVGQEDVVKNLLISIFCKGHCLLVGVPGLAKTLMVNTLSKALGLNYSRIQFTPDLMPSDIIGSEILDENRKFRFIKGPVFANIILADEINRTPPKTQSALLEAMQEKAVTVAGTSYHLQEPFFVLATQNPIEQEGTYPLPEAQLDRFMFNIWLDYPSFEEEINVVKNTTSRLLATPNVVVSAEEILFFQDLILKIPVPDQRRGVCGMRDKFQAHRSCRLDGSKEFFHLQSRTSFIRARGREMCVHTFHNNFFSRDYPFKKARRRSRGNTDTAHAGVDFQVERKFFLEA